MKRFGAGAIILDGDEGLLASLGVGNKGCSSWPMGDMEIFVGNHGAAAVVFAFADDVDPADIEGVGVADDGANIEIMGKILDGDLKGNAGFVEIVNDLLVGESLVFID